ncbi:MAG: ROK family protein [Clostridiales bacterium]|nr:ROK family protein [Clostridiales bacterium]
MLNVGIDIGGTGIQLGLVNEKGEIVQRGGIVTRTDIPFSQQIEALAKCVLETIEKGGYTLDDITAIGAGIPGVADPATGRIPFCTNLGWKDVDFKGEMRKHIDKPVFIDNDATVAGLAENVAGVSAGAASSVFLTLGTGVGGAIVLGGKVWSGHHGVGSEIGHMILVAGGEQCTCGNKGCLERYCSATAIIRMAREAVKEHPETAILAKAEGDPANINAKMVIDAAKEGDAIGLQVFDQYIQYLAQAISNVIMFLDPEVIVLGGGVSKAGDFLLNAVREALPRYVLYKALPYAHVELAHLGADAGIIGAAMLGQ